MNNKPYIERTYKKFDTVLPLYAARIFKTVEKTASVYGMETQDHLRTVPNKALLREIPNGYEWGEEYGNLWLVTDYTVPAELDGQILCAIPEANATEILCFKNGKPAGIINSKNHFIGGEHSAMFVSPSAKAGETISLAFECYAGHDCLGTFPYDNYNNDGHKGYYRRSYDGIRIAVVDTLMLDFVFDLSTVLQIAALPEDNFIAMKAHECLMDAFPYLLQDLASADEEEIRYSCEKVRECLAPALEKGSSDRSRGKIGAIGHSHMDTAWLWPVSETIRKCARTYSQALNLMEIYPDYNFIQSSALHLDWMREYYPDIFEGIRARVAEGRYEPNGGVWVECDCNITGGESMVRQFLYGQRFTEKYLGYRSDAFWLPDTFGYNAAIPQIMHGAGVKYFYTQKISWNDLNMFPSDTFVWRGIDGSEVITHFNHMHAMPDVKTIHNTISGIRDKYSNDMRLFAYGFGDGGGGPTFGMLEYLKRTRNMDGFPEIEPTTASRFMKDIEKRRDKLPVYDGELYLEFHRGTLTQMHDVKKNNRKCEIALYNMELASVLANDTDVEKRDALYKILLKNQFHDILPGTSIPKVYEIALPEMRQMIADAENSTEESLNKLKSEADGILTVFNPMATERDSVVAVRGMFSLENRATQTYKNQNDEMITVFRSKIAPLGTEALVKTALTEQHSRFISDANSLETPYYTVIFDENGYISSLIDKEKSREIANTNGAPLGTLWFGEDMPTSYDNWEVEDDIFRKLKPVTYLMSREVISDGAVEYRIRSTYKIGRKSTAVVDTVFYADSRQIDYEMKLDWHDRHSLLKVGFDVNIRSAFVKNEIQFGHVDRPTTRNNSLECAKFEVCNHKWSDLSETNYGVAILNDCKYGISAEGSDMRLTLQRGGCRPDPITDFGVHTMKYALLPHIGPFSAESVVIPSYSFNHDVLVLDNAKLSLPSLFDISAANIICESVKAAEDVPNAYVIRLYESERSSTSCTLTLRGAKSARLTNLLEETVEELPVNNGEIKLNFKPFEIKTVLVEKE